MHQTYQTYQTSHLTLQDLQNNDVSAEDLIELCIELGEEYSDFGFSSYIPESSVIAALQPTVWTPPSPITRTRQENALLFGTGESARAARERAIRSLLEEKKAPYEEAVQLVEQRWEEMPKDPCEDGSTTCVGQETLEDWKKSDLYEKVAIMYRYQHPPPKDPRDVEVLLNDGHSTELRKIRLQSTDSLDKVTGIFRELSMRYNDEGELVESGSGAWMYQLMNARRKSVVGRRKLLSDRDYRMMVKEINGKDTKTPYAVVVQVELISL